MGENKVKSFRVDADLWERVGSKTPDGRTVTDILVAALAFYDARGDGAYFAAVNLDEDDQDDEDAPDIEAELQDILQRLDAHDALHKRHATRLDTLESTATTPPTPTRPKASKRSKTSKDSDGEPIQSRMRQALALIQQHNPDLWERLEKATSDRSMRRWVAGDGGVGKKNAQSIQSTSGIPEDWRNAAPIPQSDMDRIQGAFYSLAARGPVDIATLHDEAGVDGVHDWCVMQLAARTVNASGANPGPDVPAHGRIIWKGTPHGILVKRPS